MDRPTFLHVAYPHTAAASATDSFAGTTADNVLAAGEDTFWRPADVTGDKSLTLDLGERLVDRLCLLGEPLDGVKIDLRASTDNFVASDVAILTDQVLSAPVNAATLAFTAASYRYWRVIFKSGFMPSPLRVAFVALAMSVDVPYLEADYDPGNVDTTGVHLVSLAGMYLGSNLERRMRQFALNLGTITEGEFFLLRPWSEACAGRMEPFFFVPDRSAAECHFGWLEKTTFSAPLEIAGMRRVAALTYNTRAA